MEEGGSYALFNLQKTSRTFGGLLASSGQLTGWLNHTSVKVNVRDRPESSQLNAKCLEVF